MRYYALAAAALMLTGCTSNGLVHDKNYVRAAAVTSGSGAEITLAFFSDGSEPLTVTGETISDALGKAQLRTGREIFTGFTELLIIDGTSSAETLEYMLSEWKLSPSCSVAYSGSGSDVLMAENAELLRGAVKEAERSGKAPDCGIVTVLKELMTDGSAEVAELPDAERTAVIYK